MAPDSAVVTKGIVDFDDKLQLLMLLVGCRTAVELAPILLKKTPKDERHVVKVERLYNSFKSWRQTGANPSDPIRDAGRTFLAAAIAVLKENGCSDPEAEKVLWKGSIDELVGLLPPASITPAIDQLRRKAEVEADMVVLKSAPDHSPRSIKMDFDDGRVDQRLMYLVPDAAEVWKDVVDARTYKQYEHCQEALEKFLSSDVWTKFCKEKAPDGAVEFGAGSASKDLMIIRSLDDLVPDPPAKLSYALVDYSIYMLQHSERIIQKDLRNDPPSRTVYVEALHKDFMSLKPWRVLRRKGTPVAWFITGGTIGNINENDFLHSVARRAEPGDLLMVSMETIPPEAKTPEGRLAFKKGLREKYNHKALQQLLRPSLAAIWPYLDHEKTFEEALDLIEVDVIDGTHRRLSSVPKSLSVVFSIQGPEQLVDLLASTRYDEQAFISSASDDDFHHLGSYASHKNPSYKILAFEFQGRRPLPD